MEVVIITFATHDETFRFTYLRGHYYGQLECLVGPRGSGRGKRWTVHVEEIRDLVVEGDSPTIVYITDGGVAQDGELRLSEIKEVVKRELYLREAPLLTIEALA